MKYKGIRHFLLIVLVFIMPRLTTAQRLEKGTAFSQYKFTPVYNAKKVGNTSIFQGNNETEKYFEGWYFKMVSHDGSSIISVIPGISLPADRKNQHAFIQIINGSTAQASYHSFPIGEFSYSRKEFAVKIGNNYFSKDSLVLNIQDSNASITGKIKMTNTVDYKSGNSLVPGIMGWYRFVPFMQCYHGVVSLTHKLNGHLNINENSFNFDEGKGYLEKDWGKSMPSSWIWMQSNHFRDSSASFMLSIADIPWLGNTFTGYLGFFYHNNKIHHFATYRDTKLHLNIAESNALNIKIQTEKNIIILQAVSNNTALLKAPQEGLMDRRIPESIDATIKITMYDSDGKVLIEDSTKIAGLEMVGDYKHFQGLIK